MTWFKVYSPKIKTHRKFRALPNAALGAWLRIRAEVDLLEGEPLPDLDFTIDLAQGDRESVEMLLDVGLLDEDEDGTIHIHDLADWGRAGEHVKPSDTPSARTERSRRHRERKRLMEDATPATPPRNAPATPATPATPEEKRVDQIRSDETRSGAREAEDDEPSNVIAGPWPWDSDDPNDPVDVWFRLTGRFPRDGAKEWMLRLMRDWGGGRVVVAAMLDAYNREPDLSNLLSRTEELLKMQRHHKARDESEALQAAVAGPARQVRQQTPEERAEVERRNAERARAARKDLLFKGIVQPTRPGDEELLREARAERDPVREVHTPETGTALSGGTH